GPWDGLGLIVSRDEAEPGRRIPGLGAGGIAGLLGSDLGAGSGGGFRSTGEGAAEADGLAADFDPFGDVGLAGRSAARGRGASPRARDGFFDGLLEELTPELPDPPDWVRHRPQSYDGRLRLHLRESLWSPAPTDLGPRSCWSLQRTPRRYQTFEYLPGRLSPIGRPPPKGA